MHTTFISGRALTPDTDSLRMAQLHVDGGLSQPHIQAAHFPRMAPSCMHASIHLSRMAHMQHALPCQSYDGSLPREARPNHPPVWPARPTRLL